MKFRLYVTILQFEHITLEKHAIQTRPSIRFVPLFWNYGVFLSTNLFL